MYCLSGLLLLPLAPLVCEDFRRRRVRVLWLVLSGAGAVLLSAVRCGVGEMLIRLGVNTALLLVLCGCLVLWLRLRRLPLRTSFGMGDVAFMLVAAPLFEPEGYVRFLLASCLAALVWWGLSRRTTIPLAGIMGCMLAVFILFDLWN